MGENRAWQDMRYGNLIPSPQHEWVWMWGSIQIRLQCLHNLARSPCTGVCMPVGDWFLNPLFEKFHIQVPRQLWLERGPAIFSQRKCWMWQVWVLTHRRLDEQSTWTLEGGEWMIEYQAERWFCRVRDIFWRVSLKVEWFERTEPWQRLCHLLWNQEQGNVAHQRISDNTVGVKIADDGLYFIFSFHFILFSLFSFLFLFLFIEQLRLGFISHKLMA